MNRFSVGETILGCRFYKYHIYHKTEKMDVIFNVAVSGIPRFAWKVHEEFPKYDVQVVSTDPDPSTATAVPGLRPTLITSGKLALVICQKGIPLMEDKEQNVAVLQQQVSR